MSIARIYKPAKSAMQSGRAKTRDWVLEFEPRSAKRPDRLMGWISSEDMKSDQVRLRFPTREAAAAFAERHGIPYRVRMAAKRDLRPKSYADNFRPDRVIGNWTH